MVQRLNDWDRDITKTAEEEYHSLLRALRRTKKFGMFFVECAPVTGKEIIARIKKDLQQKQTDILTLEQPIEKLFDLVTELRTEKEIEILFITGLETSLYEYERIKRQQGWDSWDVYNYSWKGVPRILDHLNQQRERFRDNFDICFVFLLPRFAIDYFIHRAPDFFDWRSGLFKFPDENQRLQGGKQYIDNIPFFFKNDSCITINVNTCNLVKDRENIVPLGDERYRRAIGYYDEALKLKPHSSSLWNDRGFVLANLGRYEEALQSYNRAIALDPGNKVALKNRINTLAKLGR